MIDPASLMQIKSMELRAKVIVEGFWKGIHRSPFHGFSAEFTEYRQYTYGDDPRTIDWRVYARSDRFYIKKFQDETNLRCHLLIDQSRSMGYGSRDYSKADYAGTLAATLAKPGKYLSFVLGREEYGLEILKVQEIIGIMEVTRVPRTPPYVRGVINLRGRVIPVVELRSKFQMPTVEDTEKSCVIVVQVTQGDLTVTIDGEVGEFREFKLRRDPDCPDCGSLYAPEA